MLFYMPHSIEWIIVRRCSIFQLKCLQCKYTFILHFDRKKSYFFTKASQFFSIKFDIVRVIRMFDCNLPDRNRAVQDYMPS